MGRTYKKTKKTKTLSQSRKNNLLLARHSLKLHRSTEEKIRKILLPKKHRMESNLKELSIPVCLQKAKNATNKYWNERKRSKRLKSHMSNKAERVRELKKAIERYKAMRLEPPLIDNVTVSGDIQMVDCDTHPDDSFYASDYEDNMV